MLEQFQDEARALLNLPDQETGEAPESRLSTADALRGLWAGYEHDDRLGSYNRSIVRELANGAPPYDQGEREEEGQGELFNVNTGHARTIIDAAVSGFMDIFTNDRNMVVMPLSSKIPANARHQYQRAVETRFTKMLRSWDCFTPRITTLCYNEVVDGIGVLYFEDEKTWKIGSASLSEMKFPSRCEPVSSKIPVALMKKTMHVGELYRKIQNEDAANEAGWNKEEVIKVIHEGGKSKSDSWRNPEKLLEDLKANELHVSNTIDPVELIYGFIEEYDGSVSLYVASAHSGEFLQKQYGKFKSMNQALQVFPYAIGENNRLYTIRGMGYFIHQIANAENIMFSDLLNAAKVGSLPHYQASGTEDLEDASFLDVGSGRILPIGLNLVEDGSKRDLRGTIIPAMGVIDRSLQNTSGGLSEGAMLGDRANEDNISATLEQMNVMNGFGISLSYPPLDRVFREMARRIFAEDNDTEESLAMKKALIEEDGVPEEVFKMIMLDDIQASRLLGGGNKANRINTMKDIRANVYPSMDAQGRKESDYDYILERAGKEQADKYIGVPSQSREVIDTSIAEIENFLMLDGTEVEPKDGQNHMVHLEEHVEQLLSTKDLVESGELDLEEYTLRNILIFEHAEKHLAMVVPNEIIEAEINDMNAQVQRLGEFFQNGLKAIEKTQRENPPQQEGVDPEAQAKQTEEQMRIEAFLKEEQRKDQKNAADIDRGNAKAQAEIAAKDALTANKIKNS